MKQHPAALEADYLLATLISEGGPMRLETCACGARYRLRKEGSGRQPGACPKCRGSRNVDRYGLVRFGRMALPLLRRLFANPGYATNAKLLLELETVVREHDAKYGGPSA